MTRAKGQIDPVFPSDAGLLILSSRKLEVKPNQGIACHALIPFEKMS